MNAMHEIFDQRARALFREAGVAVAGHERALDQVTKRLEDTMGAIGSTGHRVKLYQAQVEAMRQEIRNLI